MTLLEALIFIFLLGLYMFFFDFIHQRNAKKCGYDCSKCKNWECMSFHCAKKRESDS